MADREKVLKGLECCCSMTGEACRQCPYDEECAEMIGSGFAHLCSDALELLKEQQKTIVSLQSTINKLTKALAEQPEQKFFVDSDGKMTPLPVQKHGHWIRSPKFLSESQCSVCKETHVGDYRMFKFCPDCGARMDEEVEQDADD